MDFWFELVPFEVGRHRHGQDGNGQPNLSNIVNDLRERVMRRMQAQGKYGSDIIFKSIVYMDFYIIPSQLTRRLQPRRIAV